MKIGSKMGLIALISCLLLSADVLAMRGHLNSDQPRLAETIRLATVLETGSAAAATRTAKAQTLFDALAASDAVLDSSELETKLGAASALDAASPSLLEVLVLVGAAIALAALPFLIF